MTFFSLPGMAHERKDAREVDGTDETALDDQDQLGTEGHEAFVLLVINAQNRLYAYILSLVLDKERARDILQQTNLVLLEKEIGFTHGTEFFAWAARVAFYEVLADRRRRVRDRHLFSDELLAAVASESLRTAGAIEERTEALRHCLSKLSNTNRDLLMQRYRPDGSVAGIAESLGKTPGALSAILHRLRSGLVDCIERKLRSHTQA